MRRNKISILGSIAGMLFLVGVATPVTFTSCDTAASMPEINLTMESDYSGIIEAIKNGNKSLTDQLALIETAIKNGFKGNDEAIKLIEAAVKALQGTVEDKLAAIETAIESQTTSLETKLGLIEAAVKTGAADAHEQQELIAKAIKALQGSLEEKLSKIEEAVKGQTTSLETKLGLIETAVKEGLAGSEEEQKLIQEAIEALEGTVEDKLAKLEEAIKGQTTSLETKLAAIEAAVNSGAADAAEQQELIKEAIEALGDALGDAMSSIKSAIGSQTTGLSTKLAAIETALKNGFVNEKNALDLIKTAVASISTTVGGMGTAMGVAVQNIIDAINGISSSSSSDDIAQALNDIFGAIEGLTDFETIIPAILAAVQDATRPIPNVERQWLLRDGGGVGIDAYYDFGYTFKNYLVGWHTNEPEYEAGLYNSSDPYTIKLLENGYVKVEQEGGRYFYLFSEVTETTATAKFYMRDEEDAKGQSWSICYLDEYGWTNSYVYNFELSDPALPLTWSELAVQTEGINYHLWEGANYNCEPLKVLYDDVLGGWGGSLPAVVIDGYGSPEDYEDLDVTDKVVVVKRHGSDPNEPDGSFPFWRKLQYASQAGALAVICVNDEAGTLYAGLDNLPSSVNPIPFFTASKVFGEKLGLFTDSSATYETSLGFIKITDPNNATWH